MTNSKNATLSYSGDRARLWPVAMKRRSSSSTPRPQADARVVNMDGKSVDQKTRSPTS